MVEISAQMPIPNVSASPTLPNQGQNPVAGDPSKTTGQIRAINAPFQITTLHKADRWLKMILYGRHGAGKTELAATAVDVPEMNEVLFISAESGLMTVYDSPRVKAFEKIHNIPVTTFKQVAYIHEFLAAYCKARDAGNKAAMAKLYSQVTGIPVEELSDPPIFRTVVIDSLTELEAYCTYGILNIDANKVMRDGDMDVAGWPEFRKNNEMVKLLVRAFRDLPMHIIMTCAEQWTQDEQKRYHYTPALTGKLSAQVQGFVDIVGWITVGQLQEGQIEAPRRVYVQPLAAGPKFDAKNRRPVFRGAFFDNPSMGSIMKDIGMLKSS